MTTPLIQLIKSVNQNRLPDLLELKYKTMRREVFRFFRGTPEVFYSHLPANSFLFDAPQTWICGDLHLENFGGYKGNDRHIYFDINDFDNGTLGSVLLDVGRMAASMHVAAGVLSFNTSDVTALAEDYVQAYALHLSQGSIRMVTLETSPAAVVKVLNQIRPVKRRLFMEEIVETRLQKPVIRPEKGKRIELPAEKRRVLLQEIENWAQTQPNPGFFKPLDVCRRIAGTGSLGVERYLVLIQGLNTPTGLRLLDIKEARPAGSIPALMQLPGMESDARRVVQVFQRMAAAPPAHLGVFDRGSTSFVVREYRGGGENLPLSFLAGKLKKARAVAAMLGALTAWDHLRGSSRQGAATADALITFGAQSSQWLPRIHTFAEAAAAEVRTDFQEYARAFDAGAFRV